MVLRVIIRAGLPFGMVLLGLIGMLTFARRDKPDEWVIFSLKHPSKNEYDIYQVLSDGTHTRQLTTTSDEFVWFWMIEDRPGWMTMQDSIGTGQHRLQLVHLLGYTQFVASHPSAWPALFGYNPEQQTAYLTITDDYPNNREYWSFQVDTNQLASFQLPFLFEERRAEFAGGGFIFWSDHASAGDLYAARFSTPPQVTRLTTSGKVLPDRVFLWQKGWLYYWVDDDDTDPYQSLYRIRTDGTDAALVVEHALIPPKTTAIWASHTGYLYFWMGDPAAPHLVRSRPDGSQMVDLPIGVFSGTATISPDELWVYYSDALTEANVLSLVGGDLQRVNLQTGEHQTVWQEPNVMNYLWSTDGKTLVLQVGELGFGSLYRMQPDGSQATLITDDLGDSYLGPFYDTPIMALNTWGVIGEEIKLLDLRTLTIHPLHDDAPAGRTRKFLTTVPMPDFDWQAGWLIGIGMAAVGVGVMAQRRS